MSKKGFVYVLAHKGAHKGSVKIGESQDPGERARHANIFDPDREFYVSSAIQVSGSPDVERDVHAALNLFRRGNTEFFDVDPRIAYVVAKAVAGVRLLAGNDARARKVA